MQRNAVLQKRWCRVRGAISAAVTRRISAEVHLLLRLRQTAHHMSLGTLLCCSSVMLS